MPPPLNYINPPSSSQSKKRSRDIYENFHNPCYLGLKGYHSQAHSLLLGDEEAYHEAEVEEELEPMESDEEESLSWDYGYKSLDDYGLSPQFYNVDSEFSLQLLPSQMFALLKQSQCFWTSEYTPPPAYDNNNTQCDSEESYNQGEAYLVQSDSLSIESNQSDSPIATEGVISHQQQQQGQVGQQYINNQSGSVDVPSVEIPQPTSVTPAPYKKTIFKHKVEAPYKKNMSCFRSKDKLNTTSNQAYDGAYVFQLDPTKSNNNNEEVTRLPKIPTENHHSPSTIKNVEDYAYPTEKNNSQESPHNQIPAPQTGSPPSVDKEQTQSNHNKNTTETTTKEKASRTCKQRKIPWKRMNPTLFQEIFQWESTQSRVKQSQIEKKFNVNRSTYYRWKKKYLSNNLNTSPTITTA